MLQVLGDLRLEPALLIRKARRGIFFLSEGTLGHELEARAPKRRIGSSERAKREFAAEQGLEGRAAVVVELEGRDGPGLDGEQGVGQFGLVDHHSVCI